MGSRDIEISYSEQPVGLLFERGWSISRSEGLSADAFVRELVKLGERLGTRVAGRAGSLEEIVQPLAADDAHPRSLSARYGLDALPFLRLPRFDGHR